MKFIKVDHSLNKRFFVEDLAFKKLIEKIFKRYKKANLISHEVKVNNKKNSFIVKLLIEINKQASYAQITKELQANIEESSILLTNNKPENIQIFFQEKE